MTMTQPTSRRSLLRLVAMGGLASALGFRARAAAASPVPATPQDALRALVDGNARYVRGSLISIDEDLELIRQNTEESQEPFAAVLSCADSRVPPELVFDQTIGRLFVTRVAGNIATTEIIASLEYAAIVLGVKVIMALGHENCGAVKAAASNQAVPGQISALYAPLRPAVVQGGPTLDGAIRANARIQALLLGDASPVLAGLAQQGKLLVVAGYYQLATGQVVLLP